MHRHLVDEIGMTVQMHLHVVVINLHCADRTEVATNHHRERRTKIEMLRYLVGEDRMVARMHLRSVEENHRHEDHIGVVVATNRLREARTKNTMLHHLADRDETIAPMHHRVDVINHHSTDLTETETATNHRQGEQIKVEMLHQHVNTETIVLAHLHHVTTVVSANEGSNCLNRHLQHTRK